MVEGLAKANNINCEVKYITASGYKLTQFATTGNAYNTEIVNALSKEKWDFVILQEHRENIMGNLEATENQKLIAQVQRQYYMKLRQIILVMIL